MSTTNMSRRAFVKAAVTTAVAPALIRCGLGPDPIAAPRLSARPGTPTESATLGVSALGLGGTRDGVLYVPQSYSSDTPIPLFVALHGAGGAATDWVNYYTRAEARGMVILAPDSRSSTWDLLRSGFGPDVEFLDRALAYTFARCRIDPSRVALAGFSDGASYAVSLGVTNGDLFTNLLAYSPGVYAPGTPRVGQPRVFVSHGTQDTVIPVTISRDVIVPELRRGGYDVTYREFNGPHGVPSDIGEASLDWFLGTG
jgi:phospholipase/carboxylesterase